MFAAYPLDGRYWRGGHDDRGVAVARAEEIVFFGRSGAGAIRTPIARGTTPR